MARAGFGYTISISVRGVPANDRRRLGRQALERARYLAPVDTGALRAAIGYFIRAGRLHIGDVSGAIPYMRVQELRHRSKSGFLRRGLESIRQEISVIQMREGVKLLPVAAIGLSLADQAAARAAAIALTQAVFGGVGDQLAAVALTFPRRRRANPRIE